MSKVKKITDCELYKLRHENEILKECVSNLFYNLEYISTFYVYPDDIIKEEDVDDNLLDTEEKKQLFDLLQDYKQMVVKLNN